MINFLDADKREIEDFFEEIGEKRFRASQLTAWLYRGASSFSEMTDLSKELRTKLEAEEAAGRITLGKLEKLDSRESADKSTEKFLFGLADGNAIETVLMRYKYGNSVCVSSQAGCRMGCAFCASTIGGLKRNLTAGEMIAQVIAVLRHLKDEAGAVLAEKGGAALAAGSERIGHIVIMGTGEPFDNYDNVKRFIELANDPKGLGISMRNITLSTCGIVPMIRRFAEELPQVNLAISLHAPNNETRDNMMPVNKKYPLEELLPACAEYVKLTGRRITFEYALAAGVNDNRGNAEELSGLLRHYFRERNETGGLCHVNLIPLNKVKETGMEGSDRKRAEDFRDYLINSGIPATIRREMGADINAACGQLRLSRSGAQNN